MYIMKKAAIKRILGQNKQRFSLKTDIWVAPYPGASYMVITAHFIDPNWQLRKLIIGFKNVSDHKRITISNALLEWLEEWDIKRVLCITVDNVTANSSAMMIQEKEVDESITAIRNGITYVRSSTSRLKAFEFRVESGRMARSSLSLDVKTRWNSNYLMLDQALKFKVAFEKMAAEGLPYSDYFLEEADVQHWYFHLQTLSLPISCKKEIVTITANIKALSSSSGPDLELSTNALAMLSKLDKYWNPFVDRDKVEMNQMIIAASVFDPRKKMKFAQLCFEELYGKDSAEAMHMFDSVEFTLKSLYEEYSV
ncbi:zinc finger BED domain-containing protein RICESLEEPER 2-like [Eutrema salsugineum]|uniref:zinc finger BED domain-containing protein RICESLEEPER 2-like n=1 Tax=Eutrema salsugineum TaxID=72664 RepID=UPI000CED3FBB|nr:zinc finger BED domain-containing protein RICESLEEPER 2-like [Eutrema salsugineum]